MANLLKTETMQHVKLLACSSDINTNKYVWDTLEQCIATRRRPPLTCCNALFALQQVNGATSSHCNKLTEVFGTFIFHFLNSGTEFSEEFFQSITDNVIVFMENMCDEESYLIEGNTCLHRHQTSVFCLQICSLVGISMFLTSF